MTFWKARLKILLKLKQKLKFDLTYKESKLKESQLKVKNKKNCLNK